MAEVSSLGVTHDPLLLSSDENFTMAGAPSFAKQVATALINDGIDVAFSYEPRRGINFPHAFREHADLPGL